ncbi:T9SS type A sorting domain-containing protein [Candidatus Neomarinimicrobiota bacterium]
MKSVKRLIVLGLSVSCLTGVASGSSTPISSDYDFKMALDYAFGPANIDTLILSTSGGVYTTTDTSYLAILKPLTIIAAPGLAEKPIFTHSDPDSNVLEIFRIFDDFTVDGVIFDGGHAQSHGMKYAMRFGHEDELPPLNTPQKAKIGTNITIKNCDFRDFYEDKDLAKDGHALYFLRPQAEYFPGTDLIKAGDVLIENCTFTNFGYEPIRISETEKYPDPPAAPIESCLESLTVRNCTFTNIDAECVRYYSDLDATTPDAPVLVEHLTINNSATRVMFLKNSGGAIVRDILITNSRSSGPHGRDEDLLDAQGNTDVPSFVSHIDTFNIYLPPGLEDGVPIESADGEVDETTIFGFDPQYAAPLSFDYTLSTASHAFWSGHDGETMGDLRWATNTPTTLPFYLTVDGPGSVTLDPPIEGRCYDPGTAVTLTAVPDSAMIFTGWSGDLSGENATETVTVNAATAITATFDDPLAVEETGGFPTVYRLAQNYPNPFNPLTRIAFDLPQSGWATLSIYNLLGQQIATLLDEPYEAGRHVLDFDASKLSSGIYFYQLRSNDFISIKKMVFLK